VRTRSGYYLDTQETTPNGQDTREIDDAIVAVLEYTGVLLNVEHGDRDAAKGTVPFRLFVPGAGIMTTPGQTKLSFDVVSVPISAHGTPIPGVGRISQINMDRSAMEKALKNGWTLVYQTNAPQGAFAVKLVVRDNVTGRIGSVVFPLAEHTAITKLRVPKSGAALLLDKNPQ
jgi:hypothetical protein